MKKPSLADRVVELFRENPNRWIRERQIMAVGGTAGFRSRIDDARKRGLNIVDRTRRKAGRDGVVYPSVNTCSDRRACSTSRRPRKQSP